MRGRFGGLLAYVMGRPKFLLAADRFQAETRMTLSWPVFLDLLDDRQGGCGGSDFALVDDVGEHIALLRCRFRHRSNVREVGRIDALCPIEQSVAPGSELLRRIGGRDIVIALLKP